MTDTTFAAAAVRHNPHHDALTQAFHWVSLIAVGSAIFTGWTMEELLKGPEKLQMVYLHASLGVLILALTVVRLLWRTAAPRVNPLERPWWLFVAAKVIQVALYVLLVAIPVSGLLIMAAKGRSFEVFGLFVMPPLTSLGQGLSPHAIEEAHEAMVNLLIALVGLHSLAALMHQFILKDNVLLRMTPFGRRD